MRYRKICFSSIQSKKQQKLVGVSVCGAPNQDLSHDRDYSNVDVFDLAMLSTKTEERERERASEKHAWSKKEKK